MDKSHHIEALIVAYLNGTLSDMEYQELRSWVGMSDTNQREFDRIREIWLAANLAQNENFQFDSRAAFERFEEQIATLERTPTSRRKPKTFTLSYRWAAATVVFALLVGGFFKYVTNPSVDAHSSIAYQEIIVPNGSRSKIILPDSSYITVNAGTTLRYNTDFGKKNRNIWLDGEAYFVVKKSEQPFVVHSGTVQIKAVGTEFNVRAYSSEGQVETTLISGKVIVTDTNSPLGSPEEVALLPNQKLIMGKESPSADESKAAQESAAVASAKGQVSKPARNIIKQERIDPAPNISWKDAEWVIYRESLGDLSVKLERRYNVSIVFVDDHLKSFRYNGTLPDVSLEQVLKIMSMVSPIRYTVQGKTVVFSEK